MGSSKGKRWALSTTATGLLAIAATLFLLRAEIMEWLQDEVIDPIRLSEPDRRVKEKLLERHTIAFPDGTPFHDAMKVLSSSSGINIMLTKDGNRIVQERELKVALPEERNVRLRKILDRILRVSGDADFRYAIRSGTLMIGPRNSMP